MKDVICACSSKRMLRDAMEKARTAIKMLQNGFCYAYAR